DTGGLFNGTTDVPALEQRKQPAGVVSVPPTTRKLKCDECKRDCP
ncbi:hypothetical protein AVEN_260228-1, partial [Araneus ventricosus]